MFGITGRVAPLAACFLARSHCGAPSGPPSISVTLNIGQMVWLNVSFAFCYRFWSAVVGSQVVTGRGVLSAAS
jgi:hypothetical protein